MHQSEDTCELGSLVGMLRYAVCWNGDCAASEVTTEKHESEAWPLILLPNAEGDASIPQLLANAWRLKKLEEGTRCEHCGAEKEVRQQNFWETTSPVICFGFPRGDDHAGETKNTNRIICNHTLTCGSESYTLCGLVEHIGDESKKASAGHYIAWIPTATVWQKIDDAHVSASEELPIPVEGRVVLAIYATSSSTVLSSASTATHALTPPPLCEQGAKAEHPANGLLPEKNDGEREFQVAVEGLLCAYRAGSNCVEQLAAMEHFSCELRETEWSTFCERLWNAVEEYMQSEIVAAEAVELEAPLWRTCFLPIVVLFDAWSKTTGLPTVFYLDAFYSLISSLLNKNITFNAANFACRARYWAVGTAAPGSGKSPALDPLKNALVEVMKEMPDLSPGEATDHFHMQPVGTHCAAIDRLQSTGGYEFFGASEGGPVLCPSWPTQSKWEQGGYVNWQRYLDAATGVLQPNKRNRV